MPSHTNRLRLLIAGLAATTALASGSCATQAPTVETSTNAGVPVTSTTEPGGSSTTNTTTDPSSTSTTEPTTSTTQTTTTTALATDPITAATDAITTALIADGHRPEYAACIISTAARQFTGNAAQFVAGALALGHPTDSGPTDTLKQIQLSPEEQADIPGHIQAIYDTCANTDAH